MVFQKIDVATRLGQFRGDAAQAVMLLTRIPVPARLAGAPARGAAAAWAWPLAGLLVALSAGAVGWAVSALGVPPPVVAAIVLATAIVLTGALHEDGLADTADGLWGAWTPARRLEIMKDSHIGTYGVLALGLSLLLRWQALALILEQGAPWEPLVCAAVLSRAPMAVLMVALRPAREGGLSRGVGRPGAGTAMTGALVAIALALVAVGPVAMALAVAVGVVTLACGVIAQRKIGGQTGDILGATQQVSEMTVLVILAAL